MDSEVTTDDELRLMVMEQKFRVDSLIHEEK